MWGISQLSHKHTHCSRSGAAPVFGSCYSQSLAVSSNPAKIRHWQNIQIQPDFGLYCLLFAILRKKWVVIRKLDAGHREAWPELIIACDVRGHGLLQTDRQKDRHHNRVTYCVFCLYRCRRKNKQVLWVNSSSAVGDVCDRREHCVSC